MDPRAVALGWLARKPLTRAEVLRRLVEEGAPRDDAQWAVEDLERDGHLDDRRLALHWMSTRHDRLGLGEDRLVEELVRRGMEEETARAAWRELVGSGDLDPAEALRREVERRLKTEKVPLSERAWGRVYNALLRAGHPPDAVLTVLAPLKEETHDDLA